MKKSEKEKKTEAKLVLTCTALRDERGNLGIISNCGSQFREIVRENVNIGRRISKGKQARHWGGDQNITHKTKVPLFCASSKEYCGPRGH